MLPVIANFGPLIISSFGLFLALGLLLGIFVIFKTATIFEIDQEKILDLSLLSFFGGLIGARFYFVIFHWSQIGGVMSAVFLNRFPGLSIWGGLIGASLTLWYFSKRAKLDFFQVADFISVGALLGLVLGDIGCLLGGCMYGLPSKLPLATKVVGVLDKRLPTPLFESLLLFLTFLYLYKLVTKYHPHGKVLSLFLIFLGVVKFITAFLRGDEKLVFFGWLNLTRYLPLLIFGLGLALFYRQTKRSARNDLIFVLGLATSPRNRKITSVALKKSWYNYKVSWKIAIQKQIRNTNLIFKKLKRRLNVRSTPQELR